jgi:hypothetical protein
MTLAEYHSLLKVMCNPSAPLTSRVNAAGLALAHQHYMHDLIQSCRLAWNQGKPLVTDPGPMHWRPTPEEYQLAADFCLYQLQHHPMYSSVYTEQCNRQ